MRDSRAAFSIACFYRTLEVGTYLRIFDNIQQKPMMWVQVQVNETGSWAWKWGRSAV